ncbi:hypothetical protein ACV3V0_07755 [Clostridium perfringens]
MNKDIKLRLLPMKEFIELEYSKENILDLVREAINAPENIDIELISNEQFSPGQYSLDIKSKDNDAIRKLDKEISNEFGCSCEDGYKLLYSILKKVFDTKTLMTCLKWSSKKKYTVYVTIPFEDYLNLNNAISSKGSTYFDVLELNNIATIGENSIYEREGEFLVEIRSIIVNDTVFKECCVYNSLFCAIQEACKLNKLNFVDYIN